MPRVLNKKTVMISGTKFTEVPKERVQESLEQFKRRIESERQKESPYYSFPSDKTSIRILE